MQKHCTKTYNLKFIFLFGLFILTKGLLHAKSDSLIFSNLYQQSFNLRNTNIDSSFYWINEAYGFSLEQRNSEWQAKCLNLIGILYNKKNQYQKSFVSFERALRLTKDSLLIGKIYINLGNLLSEMNYLYTAKKYYEDAIRILNQKQAYQFLIRTLISLSTVEFELKLPLLAKSHTKLALKYSEENNLMEEQALCLNNLAAMFIKTNQIDSASRYIYQSFAIYNQLDNIFGLYDAYLTAIDLHLKKSEFEYAKSLIEIADSLDHTINYPENRKILINEKIVYYLKADSSQKALTLFNYYVILSDSLQTLKNMEIPAHQKSIEKHTSSDNKNTIPTLLFIIITLLFAILIIFFLLKHYRYVKE